MRFSFSILICLFLSACTTNPVTPNKVTDLFHDELFRPASVRIDPEDAMAVTEQMVTYAQVNLRHPMGHVDSKDRRLALVDAMYKKGELRLDYDATQSLTASQAFEQKKGNCLSLVLLTAAMAKQLGLPMHFQSVIGVTDWSQSDNFFMSVGHVNLVLENVPSEFELTTWTSTPVVVDFLPPERANVLETVEIEEKTVLAMFLNNRSVETLIQGNIDDAYWWAKAAIMQDPSFFNSYITLGVIYRNSKHFDLAEAILERVAEFQPDNTTMLANRILVLRDLGRDAESTALAQKLVKLDEHPPWGYYLQAQAEYAKGHYEVARHLYEREIARDPAHSEFEYGLALTYCQLKDPSNATIHLERALTLSASKQSHDFYAKKLEKFKETGSM